MKEKILIEKGDNNTSVGGPELGKVYWHKDVEQFIKEILEEIENAQEDYGNLDWIKKDHAVKIIKQKSGFEK